MALAIGGQFEKAVKAALNADMPELA